MSRSAILWILLLTPSLATANSFTASGPKLEPSHEHRWESDRMGLIEDGSFEWGSCFGGSAWTCASDNGCDWIDDLTVYGLWNYDGINVAWLGGYCNSLPTCSTSFCQDILIDGQKLTWWWMAYVTHEVMDVTVKVDGALVFQYRPLLGDHLRGYQRHLADVSAYQGGVHTLCFSMDNAEGCAQGVGDNYFLDFVELVNPTSVPHFELARASLSDLKVCY